MTIIYIYEGVAVLVAQLLSCHIHILLYPHTFCQQLLSCHLHILISPYMFCQQLLSCHLEILLSQYMLSQQLLSCHLQISSVNSSSAVTYRYSSSLLCSANSS